MISQYPSTDEQWRPLHTGRIFWHKNLFFGLLIGHEYFHTECEYHAAKKPFFKRINQSTNLQQHKQQWLTSSLSVSLSTKHLTNDTQIISKTTIADNIWQSIADQLGFANGNVSLCSLLLDEVTSANVC